MSDECPVCDELDAELMNIRHRLNQAERLLRQAGGHLSHAADIIEDEYGSDDADVRDERDFIEEIDAFLSTQTHEGEIK